ncbi:MAG: sulfotransferase [Bacteroidetes bacterium]|nr:sulfotransferase [Bacteroidota bacterium]
MTNNFRRSPRWFRAINAGWNGSYFLGTKIRLDKDELIRSARKITGLENLGGDFNDEPLERLLKAANEEANLHPIGRFITRERFVSLLSIRLRAEYFFKKHPQILEQELYPAWIIVGLQRTGTTKLQRLLAEDTDHRVIPSWEVINPVPISLELYDLSPAHLLTRSPVYPLSGDKRIAIANTSVKALKFMSPGFFAIHPIDAMQPEEDILMLDVSFMSTTPEAMMHVPSYSGWLEQTDQSQAYAYAAKLLKFMQWIRPAKRWVLKTPHHLEFPDLIEKNFGEVHFLWPHRDLQESVPSFLSMVTYNRMIFSDQVDERQVADHWVRKIGYMLGKAISYRLKGNNAAKFTDIIYTDLIADSITELTKIYSLNGGMTPELAERFRRHELEHPHRKHGIHQYSMADFGLTEAEINRHTSRYGQFISENYGRKQA